MNGSGVISTCRLLSLTIDDYEGKALEILEDALQTSPSTKKDTLLTVYRQNDALEFRALSCLVRLIDVSIKRHERIIDDMGEKKEDGGGSNNSKGSSTSDSGTRRLMNILAKEVGIKNDGSNQDSDDGESTMFQKRQWTSRMARLGEMQSLEVLRNIAVSGAREMMGRINKKSNTNNNNENDDSTANSHTESKGRLHPSLIVRSKPCPVEWTKELLIQ